MDWSVIGGKLAEIGLPLLGTAFGGPLGGTIGGALGTAIAGALGTDATPQAVSTALATSDPETIKAKLADFESARQADATMQQACLADVQDARRTNTALVEARSPLAWVPAGLTILDYVALGAVIVAVCMHWLREDGIIVGFILGAVTVSRNYWFGSSNGSKRMGDAVRSIAQSVTTSSVADAAGRVIGGTLGRLGK